MTRISASARDGGRALFHAAILRKRHTAPPRGRTTTEITGQFFLENMMAGCLMEMRAPIGEDCEFDGTINGSPMVGHM